MVRTEPTMAIATSSVRIGFVLHEIGPQPWQGDKKFLPDFLEIRYSNSYDGQGWRWSADLRGRRVNAGRKLGAADASVWFTDRADRFSTAPDWVREIAEAHRPVEAGMPSTHRAVRPSATTDRGKGGGQHYGVWRGRYPVRVQFVSLGGDEIVMSPLDAQGDGVVTDRRRSLLEFVPDTTEEG